MMQVTTGLAELFAYWAFLYWLAGAPVGVWVYNLQVWLEEKAGMR